MTLYSAAPPARTFKQDKPTLLVAWWCTLFAAVIILFRVAGRYVRSERLFREDRLAFACLVPLFVRIAFVHVVLFYGTNNADVEGLSEHSIQHRVIGARLVLASRVSYAATLWMLKFTITEFFKRLTSHIWRRSYEVTLRCIRWFLLLTFIAIILSDLLECHPFTHYWQVVPDPGAHCRQSYGQLLTMAVCNVLTDLLLVIFPIPIIICSSMPLKRKFHLVCLFALSIIPIAVTIYRIPQIISKDGRQQTRTLWASIEILAATAVANALVLGSFVRDRGVKKQKWKAGSVIESVERSISLRGTVARAWGSDEDLVRDLGLGVNYELRHHLHVPHLPRLAPTASSGNENIRYARGVSRTTSSLPRDYFKDIDRRDYADTSSEDYEQRNGNESDNSLAPMISPRKLSFFDVGGLLESASADSDTSPNSKKSRASHQTTYTISSSHMSQDFTSFSTLARQRTRSDYESFSNHHTALSPPPPLHLSSSNGGRMMGSRALVQDSGLSSPSSLMPGLSHANTYTLPSPPPVTRPRRPRASHSATPWAPGIGIWSGSRNPFSFSRSEGRFSSSASKKSIFNNAGEEEDAVSPRGGIQMRRLEIRKEDSSNGELRDVGGLLQ